MIVVVGGGPAGAMAALAAAQNGKEVTLLEKNNTLFKKLLLTGNGRCNITNAGESFFENVVHNSKFMHGCFHAFDNYAVIDFLEKLGVPLKIEDKQKVFPKSDKAADVAQALLNKLKELDVCIKYNMAAKNIGLKNGKVEYIECSNDEKIYCNACVITCGGKSYPSTGSTGDGYTLAKQCGHNIVPPQASLAPIQIKEDWVKKLQGISLSDVKLSIYNKNKRVFTENGDMIFTHEGMSGPLVFSASAHINLKRIEDYKISLDLLPYKTQQQVDADILERLTANSNKDIKNIFYELLPKRLTPVLLELAGIDSELKCNQLTKEKRQTLCGLIKNIEFYPQSVGPLAAATITRGGVDVRIINPKTMASKLVPNLHFAGEVLDIDAYTGGYNLQIAFSTGYAAGVFCGIIE